MSRLTATWIALGLLIVLPSTGLSQAGSFQDFGEAVERIAERDAFRHARFGIAVYSLDAERFVYRRNATEFFTPASTNKLVSEGAALAVLGPGHRFRTRVYRTGPVDEEGILRGDLVLVASGDPNLSNRLRSDSLAFTDYDHTYAGSPETRRVPGDPLEVIRELADQVADAGIRRVAGRVRVDATLFAEGEEAPGTGETVSPLVVNDNVIDVWAVPGETVGAPARLHSFPETAYLELVNRVATGASHEPTTLRSFQWAEDSTRYDGTHRVVARGTVPASADSILFTYRVPEPSRFGEIVFAEALQKAGISALPAPYESDSTWRPVEDDEGRIVARHASPPLSEAVKVTLKTSHNLHAAMTVYNLGAAAGSDTVSRHQAGFDLIREFLEDAGLDTSGASQAKAGAGADAFFTPEFVTRYLAYMASREDFALFRRALPVLGRDGTLAQVKTDSPAAGHVWAKTGTGGVRDRLHHGFRLTSKALAGYVTTRNGHELAFTFYLNGMPGGMEPAAAADVAGEALGELASALYAVGAERGMDDRGAETDRRWQERTSESRTPPTKASTQ